MHNSGVADDGKRGAAARFVYIPNEGGVRGGNTVNIPHCREAGG